MLSCCSVSAVMACIEIGTSWMFCERRCAVTVISASVSVPRLAGVGRRLLGGVALAKRRASQYGRYRI